MIKQVITKNKYKNPVQLSQITQVFETLLSDAYVQSIMKGYIGKTKCITLPQVQILIHYLIHTPPLRIEHISGKWSWMSQEVYICAWTVRMLLFVYFASVREWLRVSALSIVVSRFNAI